MVCDDTALGGGLADKVDSWRISSYRRLSYSVRHALLTSAVAAAAAVMRCR